MLPVARYKIFIGLVTWVGVCGLLLFLWQAPEDPSNTTHHKASAPSPWTQNLSPRTHVSNLHYLQVQKGNTDGSPPYWKVATSSYVVSPSFSTPNKGLSKDYSDHNTHSKNTILVGAVGVERDNMSPTHTFTVGRLYTASKGQRETYTQHPIRHLGSGHVPEIIRKSIKSPVKMRLRHKESKRHEKWGSNTYINEDGGYYNRDKEFDSDIFNKNSTHDEDNEKTSNLDTEYRYDNKPSKHYLQYNSGSSKTKESEYIKENSGGESEDEYNEGDEYTGSRYNVTPPNALLLMYNRIPKCASSTVQTILRRLSRRLGFEHVSSLIYNQHQLSQDEQEELVDNLTASAAAAPSYALSYDRHIYYTNFTSLGMDRPVYINVIRDPVERFISSFYYRRSDERLRRIQTRGHPVSPSPSWVNRTVEQCVFSNDSECRFLPGEEKEMVLTYFCGHRNFCRIVGNQDALQAAKQVVSEEYSVVGLVDHMDISLLLMETLVPRYLTGALKVYISIRQREHMIVNKNQKKPEVSTAVREELRQRMADDIDFYSFLKQRLFEQNKTFLTKKK